MNLPPPPPPPPTFTLKIDAFHQKQIQLFGKFDGDSTDEINQKYQKSEDKDKHCMTEADGLGLEQVIEIDKTTHYQCPRCEKWIQNNLKTLHATSHSSQVLDWLYLGAENNSMNLIELTTRTNISYILNAAIECPNGYPEDFKYLHLSLWDYLDSNVLECFDEAYEFIEQCRQENKRILIHCAQGKSRSVSLVLLYLMRQFKMSLKEAYYLVKEARPIIKPNPSFVKQLREYEVGLFGKNSIEAKEINELVV